jgi:hypothetical protein|tara:strand:+ start:59 stop:394 length:336 start_codon:yes stop_codon:yes gene_type:complete
MAKGKWADREVVLKAVKENSEALKRAAKSLRADREVVLEAVRQHGKALEYADESLQGDREVVLEAVRQGVGHRLVTNQPQSARIKPNERNWWDVEKPRELSLSPLTPTNLG